MVYSFEDNNHIKDKQRSFTIFSWMRAGKNVTQKNPRKLLS
jgi:hypothetical protein